MQELKEVLRCVQEDVNTIKKRQHEHQVHHARLNGVQEGRAGLRKAEFTVLGLVIAIAAVVSNVIVGTM